MKKILLALFLSVLAPFAASAQSLTVGCSSPPPAYGVVWTAGQWITCLSSLQPWLGYTPLNQAGGTMSGELFTAPSVTSSAPLNFPPGVAPSSPANGDLWFQSTGLFYRAGGATVGPLASTTSPSFSNPTFTGTVTFPDGATWTSSAITAGSAPWNTLVATTSITVGLGTGNQVVALPNTTGNAPAVASKGVDTNVDLDLISKGTGAVDFRTGGSGAAGTGAIQFQVTNTASATRYVTATGSNGGSPALNTSAGPLQLGAAGSAALNLTAGGTNQISLAGGTTPQVSTSAGNLNVGSAGGTTALQDAAVQLSSAGYHTCALLGTSGTGTITCGGAPSGYITWNDNVTSSVSPAVTGNLYCMNTGSGALTITLPASPGNGDYVAWVDCGGNFATHNLTIANNGHNIMLNAGAMTVSTNYAGAVLRYSLGKTSWILSPL